jgi:hypothetical protein
MKYGEQELLAVIRAKGWRYARCGKQFARSNVPPLKEEIDALLGNT